MFTIAEDIRESSLNTGDMVQNFLEFDKKINDARYEFYIQMLKHVGINYFDDMTKEQKDEIWKNYTVCVQDLGYVEALWFEYNKGKKKGQFVEGTNVMAIEKKFNVKTEEGYKTEYSIYYFKTLEDWKIALKKMQ